MNVLKSLANMRRRKRIARDIDSPRDPHPASVYGDLPSWY